MAVQNLTIVEMLLKQIKNSGEIVVLSTQATDASATGSVLQILMTPNGMHRKQKNNFNVVYLFAYKLATSENLACCIVLGMLVIESDVS